MGSHARIAAFGSSGLMIAAGVAGAVLVGGILGPLLALVLIGSGLVLATSLVFLEVGLSEDRDRELELARRTSSRPARRRSPVRIRRARGHG